MDGGAWWAAVYGVAQSWTRLKRLSSSSSSKRGEETPAHMSYQLPRILFTGIHLGRVLRAPPGRTLSQGEWPETTGNQPYQKTRGCSRGRAVLLGTPTLMLSPRAPLPNKVTCFISTGVSSHASFLSVRQEPTRGPEGVPLPATAVRGRER